MGLFENLVKRTNSLVDEIEYSEANSQELYDRFLANRNDLKDAIIGAQGKDSQVLSKLLKLLNQKAKEYDMENW